jgi:hypothetical protein
MRTCKRIKIYRTETENEKLKEDQEIWNSDRECKPLGGSGDREQRHRMKISNKFSFSVSVLYFLIL